MRKLPRSLRPPSGLGRDKLPPEYKPEIGWSGRLLLLGLVLLVGVGSLGWLFV